MAGALARIDRCGTSQQKQMCNVCVSSCSAMSKTFSALPWLPLRAAASRGRSSVALGWEGG